MEVIKKAARKIAPGPAPSFTQVHIMKALEVISNKKTIGRKNLARWLALGEGETRTLVRHLKIAKLIETSRSGIALLKFGKRVLSDLQSRIQGGIDIPQSTLTVGKFNIAVLVKNSSHKVSYGLEQRDTALRVGALGATTLVFSRNNLNMPGVSEDIFREIPRIQDMLISKLNPGENDVIIIGSSDEKIFAELGAKAAALELLTG